MIFFKKGTQFSKRQSLGVVCLEFPFIKGFCDNFAWPIEEFLDILHRSINEFRNFFRNWITNFATFSATDWWISRYLPPTDCLILRGFFFDRLAKLAVLYAVDGRISQSFPAAERQSRFRLSNFGFSRTPSEFLGFFHTIDRQNLRFISSNQ